MRSIIGVITLSDFDRAAEQRERLVTPKLGVRAGRLRG
jgi:hypothetical protein